MGKITLPERPLYNPQEGGIEGDWVYDSTDGKVLMHDGTAWTEAEYDMAEHARLSKLLKSWALEHLELV